MKGGDLTKTLVLKLLELFNGSLITININVNTVNGSNNKIGKDK